MSITKEELEKILDKKLDPINKKLDRIENAVQNLNKHFGYENMIDGKFKIVREDKEEM
ncbi:MAG: hypothetical protein AAF693_05970 [Bacteroidota bacterium]